jgi:hypothetical protein
MSSLGMINSSKVNEDQLYSTGWPNDKAAELAFSASQTPGARGRPDSPPTHLGNPDKNTQVLSILEGTLPNVGDCHV